MQKRLLAFGPVTVESVRPIRTEHLSRPDGFVVLLWAFAGVAVGEILGLAFTAASSSLAGFHGTLTELSKMAMPPWWFVVAGLVGLWCGLLGATIFVQRRYRVLELPRVTAAQKTDLLYVILGVALQGVVWLAYLPFHDRQLSAPAHRLLGSATGGSLVVLAVMTVVGAPVVEEIFFRGVLVRALQGIFAPRVTGAVTAAVVLIDGALFGLFHGEWAQLPGLAVLGAILALLFVRTGRLLPSIVTHASFNGVALVALLVQRGHL